MLGLIKTNSHELFHNSERHHTGVRTNKAMSYSSPLSLLVNTPLTDDRVETGQQHTTAPKSDASVSASNKVMLVYQHLIK